MSESRVLRIGKVSSVNYQNGTARITYEDRDSATTIELPVLAWEYWMPEVEDRVLVGHLSNSSTAAVILGPLWHEDHRPVEGKAGLRRREYEHTQGAAYERYDEEAKSLEFVAGGCTVKLQGGAVAITGNLSVSGDLAVTGKITAGGTIKATGDISGPNVSVTGKVTAGGVIHSDSDVTAGSISGNSHTHTAPYGETSGPH